MYIVEVYGYRNIERRIGFTERSGVRAPSRVISLFFIVVRLGILPLSVSLFEDLQKRQTLSGIPIDECFTDRNSRFTLLVLHWNCKGYKSPDSTPFISSIGTIHTNVSIDIRESIAYVQPSKIMIRSAIPRRIGKIDYIHWTAPFVGTRLPYEQKNVMVSQSPTGSRWMNTLVLYTLFSVVPSMAPQYSFTYVTCTARCVLGTRTMTFTLQNKLFERSSKSWDRTDAQESDGP